MKSLTTLLLSLAVINKFLRHHGVNTSTHTKILNAFTYPTLDPIDNEPTYESLKLLREQLGENAARIPTT